MKTILITGISGFVGGHITSFLAERRRDLTIHGVSRSAPTWDFIANRTALLERITFHKLDLLDMEKTSRLLREIRPDYILHLAAFSSVAESWKRPRDCFLNNTNLFLNIIETVRSSAIDCKILSVGSSEQYGVVEAEQLPLREDAWTIPANPYAVARSSQENLAMNYAKGFQVNICCTRSFNHIGPGQSERFVVSSIAKQFASIKYKKKEPIIRIGNGAIVRDFVDINDVIAAYDALLQKAAPGKVYNVCSGKGHSILDIIDYMAKLSDTPVTVQQESSLFRPIDNPILIGSYEALQQLTDWRPQVDIQESLQKIFQYWADQIKGV